MKRVLILMAVFAVAAVAADIAGTWKATAEGPNGSMERTFVFKVDGNKLTGETTSTMLGKSTIADGKADGDNLSFSITADLQGTELKLNYEGKISGADLHLTSERAGDGGGPAIEWNGKKIQ
jgi:opacity protein-like surface antigen